MSSRNKSRRHRPASPSPAAVRRQPTPPRRGPAPRPRRVTESYTPSTPRDLPELRGQLAHWLAREGPGFYLAMALAGRQWIPPDSTSVTAGAAQIARQEHQRVVTGDLYWVSAPMTALASHAATRLPTRTLLAHDLPARSRFHGLRGAPGDLRQRRGPRRADRRGQLGPVGRPLRPVGSGRHLAQLLQPSRPGTALRGVHRRDRRPGRLGPAAGRGAARAARRKPVGRSATCPATRRSPRALPPHGRWPPAPHGG